MPHACLRTIRDEHASLTAMLTSAQLMVDRGPGARRGAGPLARDDRVGGDSREQRGDGVGRSGRGVEPWEIVSRRARPRGDEKQRSGVCLFGRRTCLSWIVFL